MIILDKNELNNIKVKQNIKFDINTGSIFIYPTDTIYGIGCDATNYEAVADVRDAKDRIENPFSVIAPSKDWIRQTCEVEEKHLDELPGQITLILKLKNKKAIAENVNNGMETLGVRIPDHWISDLVRELNKPIVTTSVNKQGEDFITNVEDTHAEIKAKVDFAINDGEIKGRPSKIINTIENQTIER